MLFFSFFFFLFFKRVIRSLLDRAKLHKVRLDSFLMIRVIDVIFE